MIKDFINGILIAPYFMSSHTGYSDIFYCWRWLQWAIETKYERLSSHHKAIIKTQVFNIRALNQIKSYCNGRHSVRFRFKFRFGFYCSAFHWKLNSIRKMRVGVILLGRHRRFVLLKWFQKFIKSPGRRQFALILCLFKTTFDSFGRIIMRAPS